MFNFRTSFIPSKFVIIGAGGTGGRLAPLLIQFLKTATWLHSPKVYIVDHDRIEDKNLTRQNFIKLDLGKFKAQVLADRYGRAFDVDVTPIMEKVTLYKTYDAPVRLSNVLGERPLHLHELTNAVVFLCVDSMKARLAILSHLIRSPALASVLVIDAGNENDFGQVLLYNLTTYTANTGYTGDAIDKLSLENDILPIDVNLPTIPCPAQFYVETKDKVATAVSCAELDQTLAINALMATSMMGVAQNFLYSKPLQFTRLNVSITNGSIPDYYSFRQFKNMIKEAYSLNNFKNKLYGEIGIPLKEQDATPILNDIGDRMLTFKAKQLGGLSAPPPLTEIKKKKVVKEPA